MKDLDFHIPSRVILGTDSFSRLGHAMEGLGTRALLITDTILADGPLPERASAILSQKGINLIQHEGVPSDSFHDYTEKYVSLAKAGQCQVVIGMGGIQTLSIAKASAILAGGDRRADDFLDGYPAPSQGLRYVEIPTTCRNPFMFTGEVLLVDSRNRNTRIMNIPGGQPDLVIMDPNLMATLTEKVGFATLMDTFLFALEGLISDKGTFLSDSLFLKAAAQLVKALECTKDPLDTEGFRDYACQGGVTAAMGLAMSSLGVGSSLEFITAGKLGLPKALLGAMLLPEILEWGAMAAPDKIIRLSPILAEDTRGLSVSDAAFRTVNLIRDLLGDVLGQLRIESVPMGKDAALAMADQVFTLPYHSSGPGVLTQEDILGIIRRAF